MTINIRQNNSVLLTEDRQVISSTTSEVYVLMPADGKVLKNTETMEIFKGFAYVNHREQIKNYIEIAPQRSS